MSAVLTSAPDDPRNQRFWDQVLPLLEEGRLVPVVGKDLLSFDVDGRRANLYELLAERVARRLGIAGEAPRSLDEVARRYLAESRQPLEDVYPALKKELAQLEALPVPPALQQLAGIGWFRLFVSTTCDNFLARAIDAERHAGKPLTRALAFGLMNNFDDLPAEPDAMDRAVVYQLFGRASAVQDTYAVTDEDLLEFVHRLQIENERPRRLFDALEGSHLLLVGGGYSPWLMRFFLRAVKHRDRLWRVRGRAAFVVDRAARDDPALLDFLRHYSDRTLVYEPADPQAGAGPVVEGFVAQLAQHWAGRQPAAPGGAAGTGGLPASAAGAPRHAVFISYASEDRPIVLHLREQLDQAGIDCWFDRVELQPGQAWAREIAAGIDGAAAFLPVISASVLTSRGREFRVEWELALEARRRRPRSANGAPARFIAPLVVDDTPMTHPKVAPYFADTQAAFAPGGTLDAAFVDLLRQLVRDSQLAG